MVSLYRSEVSVIHYALGDFERIGFRPKDILSLLKHHGIDVDLGSDFASDRGTLAAGSSHLVDDASQPLTSEGPLADAASGDTTQGRWPWGDHSTKLLEALADAARQQWSTYDPEQPGTAPTNKEVREYLQKDHGVKPTMAKAMATILRADGLQTGRRKKG